MIDRPKYELTFMAKTPHGVTEEAVVKYLTSDIASIGKHLVKQAEKYGQLHDLAFRLLPCPVCGKCSACGQC